MGVIISSLNIRIYSERVCRELYRNFLENYRKFYIEFIKIYIEL